MCDTERWRFAVGVLTREPLLDPGAHHTERGTP